MPSNFAQPLVGRIVDAFYVVYTLLLAFVASVLKPKV